MVEYGSGPRKVVVGTTMLSMWHEHPGLEARLAELGALVDKMAAEADRAWPGAGLDLAALPEVAVSGEAGGSVADVWLGCASQSPQLASARPGAMTPAEIENKAMSRRLRSIKRS